MNLAHVLEENCQRFGAKAAFIEDNSAVSYNDFYKRVCAVARRLLDAGVKKGDKILLLGSLSVDLYATLCGVWAAGACIVIFDPSAGQKHIEACLASIDIAAFVGSPAALLLRVVNKSLRKIKLHIPISALTAHQAEDSFEIVDLSPDSPALITFTSGSTGIPKAIARPHSFLLEQHAAITDALPYREDDVDLAVLSVFTLVNMMEGITTVLPRDSLRDIAKVDAGKLVRQMQRHGVTRITTSPRLMERLALWARRHNVYFENLRSVNIGGGPVFLDVLSLAATVTDPDGIRVVYGSTEAEPIAEIGFMEMSRADKLKMKRGEGLLVGVLSSRVRLRIVRGQATEPLGAKEWGEILVAGEHVVQGYLNPAQDAAAKVRINGEIWHRTGDCGYLDDSGRLWLLGRISQVIRTESGPVFPFAVESAIRGKYRVASAVIEHDGELLLVLEKNRYEQHIRGEYEERFRVIVIAKIPMDRRHASKVDYATLAKLVAKMPR